MVTVAVITASPSASAVTVPFESTDRILSSELDHEIFTSSETPMLLKYEAL
nr:hypothetical protein [Allomuricauda onchidii]